MVISAKTLCILGTCFMMTTPEPTLNGAPAHRLSIGEAFHNPLGFHDPSPVFSWKLPRGVERQTAYRIEVKGDSFSWDSGWVESEQSVGVPYGGEPLQSRARADWRVCFRDENGTESAWSDAASFELGLLSAGDWRAQWIRPAGEPDAGTEEVAWLRRTFAIPREVVQARLYVTARGVFKIHLNGQPVSRDHFANGWTSYAKRIDTLTYDVTDALEAGPNEITALLGTGWYAGRIGWQDQRHLYGRFPELLLQLEIAYTDGRTETLVSDDQWEGTRKGPIRASSIYDGETYDARQAVANWGPVIANPGLGPAALVPKPFPPVRETAYLETRDITEPAPGRFVFDLGQNIVGWARIRIPVQADGTVTLRYAEMLNPDGTLYTDNYRTAKSTDTYTAAETGTAEWEPTFTFHGFRYVELSGLPEGVKPDASWVRGVVLHSDLRRIGQFESSHDRLNQLYGNIVWGQRGNFLDIPTDCPQRDERLGWTGDAQVFCPASMFNYDCHAFWKSWLGSMRDDQFSDGRIPHVIPDALGNGDSPGWMDAATFIPWEAYVRTGDRELLSQNYGMMERLVRWYRAQSTDGLIEEIGGFGDWLQPHPENTRDNRGDTPSPLLGTAFYARSTQILADSAALLDKKEEAGEYAREAEQVRQAFVRHYFDADGKLQNAPQTQTAYLLALAFDLLPEQMRAKAAANLVDLIKEADGHLRTGFLGTPYIASVLDEVGRADLAYAILFKETYPSWFYSIDQGATTMWERWNSYSHEDGFGNVEMNSFNHYAYGAIGQWMVERVAGLAPDPANPGYQHFFIQPVIGGPLDWARAELETPYGLASSYWKKNGDLLIMECRVPPNTTATVKFPGGENEQLLNPGKHRFEVQL